jgi:tRNA/rRNA methyltransferase
MDHGYIRPVSLSSFSVVLVSPRNPLNIGAAARAMKNFGCEDLRLVDAYDVAFREARSAIGASTVLQNAREFPNVAEAVSDSSLVIGTTSVGNRELRHPLLRLDQAAPPVAAHQGRVSILFGSEKFGLSVADLSHCHWLLRIPTADRDLSMNLGQAVAVCLYEFARNPEAAALPPPIRRAPADGGQVEQIASRLLEVMRLTGYTNLTAETSTENKTRRMVRRFSLTAADARVCQGVLRQILWKLRQKAE